MLHFSPVCLTKYHKFKDGQTMDRESETVVVPDGKTVCCCLHNCFEDWTKDLKGIQSKIDNNNPNKEKSGASRAMAGVLMMVCVLMKTLF